MRSDAPAVERVVTLAEKILRVAVELVMVLAVPAVVLTLWWDRLRRLGAWFMEPVEDDDLEDGDDRVW